jgi:hypothetical protein
MSGLAINQNAILALFAGEEALNTSAIMELTALSQRQVIRAAGSLVYRGYLERKEQGVFCLTVLGAEAQTQGQKITSGPSGPLRFTRPPARETLRQRVWSAMRVMGVFSTAEIVSVACDDPSEKDHSNIRRYCCALRDAGFLTDMPTRQSGAAASSNGFKRYRLFNDTGDIAPTYRNTKKEVFDHNTKEVFACQA